MAASENFLTARMYYRLIAAYISGLFLKEGKWRVPWHGVVVVGGVMEPRPLSSSKKKKKDKVKKPEKFNFQDGAIANPRAITPPHNLDSSTVMEINGERITVSSSDLRLVAALGKGVNGQVNKMEHVPTGTMMAVKRIQHVSFDPTDEKRLLMDLETNMKARTLPHMVQFYGALYTEGDVWICMEVMDTCLDKFYKKAVKLGKSIPEEIIGKIAISMIQALQLLKVQLKIMHRDVKPSNMLINRNGDVKICDYGISGRLENSLTLSYVGTQMYMAPEYIDPMKDKGKGFSVRADVWSLGLSLMEVATGTFPYKQFESAFRQVQMVVHDDPPRLPDDGCFSAEFMDFIATCLVKEEEKRPKFDGLLQHPFITRYAERDIDIASFVQEILDTPCP